MIQTSVQHTHVWRTMITRPWPWSRSESVPRPAEEAPIDILTGVIQTLASKRVELVLAIPAAAPELKCFLEQSARELGAVEGEILTNLSAALGCTRDAAVCVEPRGELPGQVAPALGAYNPVVGAIECPPAPTLASRGRRLDQLTEREAEVARLVAAGKRNAEIAGCLVVSVRTVESHLKHVYGKLSVSSRTELCGWVREHEQGKCGSCDSD